MTSPSPSPNPEDHATATAYAERTYRSSSAIATGVLLLALGLWLGGDAVIGGDGRIPWLSLAGLLLGVPLVVGFTLRPAVFAGDDRLRVRNPFRTITAPWGAVEGVRAGYSTELLAGGRKYQLWAIPVSLRARKRSARLSSRAAAAGEPVLGGGGRGGAAAQGGRAWSDQAVEDLRELAEKNASREDAQGEVVVRWAWEVIAPAAAGVVVLGILLAV
jgi:hypothetical protein